MNFKVEVTPSNITFTAALEQTILESALSAAVNLPHGCKGGTCGSCKCKVITGKYIYSDDKIPAILTEQDLDDGYILTCKALPKSDLILDAKINKWLIKKLPAKVLSIEKSTCLAIIKLILPANQIFNFDAGQYIDLTANGITRSYSIASFDNTNNILELHMRYRVNGKFSEIVWQQLKEGQLLRVNGPFGNFTLNTNDKPIIYVCTGTGFAPIKAMLELMIRENDRRVITLLWGNSQIGDFYYLDFLEQVKNTLNIRTILCVSNGLEKSRNDFYQGMVTDYIRNNFKTLRDHQVYACGNPEMITDVLALTMSLGLEQQNFHSDAFIAATAS